MRNMFAMMTLALAGCATSAPPGVERGKSCQAGSGQEFIGQAPSAEVGRAILTATRAKLLRWAAPDMMMTMEFNASRVTVRYGTDNRISGVSCG